MFSKDVANFIICELSAASLAYDSFVGIECQRLPHYPTCRIMNRNGTMFFTLSQCNRVPHFSLIKGLD